MRKLEMPALTTYKKLEKKDELYIVPIPGNYY